MSSLPAIVTIRTSASHPLRVDWLAVPDGRRIGITIAPGKRTLSREGFRWERELGADLDALVALGVQTLVCLLEKEEMGRLGNADLLDAAKARGLEVEHAPIVDVSVPSATEATALARKLAALADRVIVIHCNGGLGRSGVVAGCLLRTLGLSAEEAFPLLQGARGPRCPETEEQRRFVRSFVPPALEPVRAR